MTSDPAPDEANSSASSRATLCSLQIQLAWLDLVVLPPQLHSFGKHLSELEDTDCPDEVDEIRRLKDKLTTTSAEAASADDPLAIIRKSAAQLWAAAVRCQIRIALRQRYISLGKKFAFQNENSTTELIEDPLKSSLELRSSLQQQISKHRKQQQEPASASNKKIRNVQMSNLHSCKSCGNEVATSARTCPNCGEKLKSIPVFAIAKWGFAAIAAILLLNAMTTEVSREAGMAGLFTIPTQIELACAFGIFARLAQAEQMNQLNHS